MSEDSFAIDIPYTKILQELANEVAKDMTWTAEFIRNEAVITIDAVNAVDTGRLRASITINKLGAFDIEIGTNVEYASYVEEGTSKMPARPYLRPALARGQQKFMERLQASIDKVLMKYFDV